MSPRRLPLGCSLLAACCLATAALTAAASASGGPWGRAGRSGATGSRGAGRSTSASGAHRCLKGRSRSHPHARCHSAKRRLRPTGSPSHPAPPATGPAPPPGPAAPGSSPASVPSGTGPPVVPAEGPGPEPPSVPHVQVSAFEYGLTLSRSTVPAGKVILEFVNSGQDEHNLNGVSGEGEPAFSFRNAQSREVHDQQVTIKPGSYTLFCSLPEHEAKGMKATLLVQ